METFYAPAERKSFREILDESRVFPEGEYTRKLMDALPMMAAILNRERQVLYANKTLLNSIGIDNLEDILGKRPGELVRCIHSSETDGGCGTSESCRYCGAINAILQCLSTGKEAAGECRIISGKDNHEVAYDFRAIASPFEFQGQDYVIFSLSDTSSQKRRRMLERIFFHDIMNTAGGLNGLISIIEQSGDWSEVKDLSGTAAKLSEELIDEIYAQKQLISAESGDLIVSPENLDASAILNSIRLLLEHHITAEDKIIAVHVPSDTLIFRCDPVILKRILVNLLKNALEASKKGETVTISYKTASDAIVFMVHNPGYIPRDIQLQIFKRSFSTKDSSRGLGTYSVKLLTEQYLKGKVSFSSDPRNGTIFSITLPLNVL